ncbi:thaumatin-like protein 1 [Ziziphus jujuba]|uniref:Thaumatin-like protein 1 n=1 Tax=Ziziphus jujuba TaxID=326968 RepID=A0ABM4A1X8_ZIZJJ|nr:thaumatin-like protein 1 [Ziziphus jujuba]
MDSRSGGDDEHNCATAGCAVNLTNSCPKELRYSDESLGCKSACQAFGEPSFCCSNRYTDFFKETCPKANSFANENPSTCSYPSFGHDFHIIFCPSSSTTRSTSSDKLLTEPMESDSKFDSRTKIKNNSRKWNKYKIAALVSGALLTATLSIAVSCRLRDVHCCNVQINTTLRL